ncbi:MAG: protease [Bacteroidetes bacterium]|nr:protease [Bacteroidota bacterium]
MKRFFAFLLCATFFVASATSQGTRLLRQPTISSTHVAFAYGGDIWVADFNGDQVKRLTSTPAVESNPHFSPDGKIIAFSSNRNGMNAVYTVSVNGGEASRHTWHPSSSIVRGWTLDGKNILFASSRDVAPGRYNRLWTMPLKGGPAKLLAAQWGNNGSFSPDGKQMILDRVSRWDVEWRAYRGGQNTPLIILDLEDLSETLLPNDKTTDIEPIWLGSNVYFLSDRDWTSNIWSYSTESGELKQLTKFKGTDIKSLNAYKNTLCFEQDGYIHTLDIETGKSKKLDITVIGDFPWASEKWENVSTRARSVGISPKGKRAIMEARGEIFTVPVEHGDARNITKSSGTADRAPLWSPKGDEIAWFSDEDGKNYSLKITLQDGLSDVKTISIGESKMAWEPTWSPDGKFIAFVDDDVRIRIVDLETEKIITADVGGNNLQRGSMGITWSPDSKWLAYAKAGDNNLNQIKVWSLDTKEVKAITNIFADASAPAWDRDKHHMYFLASTDVALGSGWANTSAMTAKPTYAAYIVNLRKDDPTPFSLRSDEEEVKKGKDSDKDGDKDADKEDKDSEKKEDGKKDGDKKDKEADELIQIDFDGIDRRIMALSMPAGTYLSTISGPAGSVFIAERPAGTFSVKLHKYTLKDRKAKDFLSGVRQASVSADGKQMLAQVGSSWKLISTAGASGKGGKTMKVDLRMRLNRMDEWTQIFEEAWRHERDYFYDPDMHGRDWNKVYKRYAPLIPFVKHRADLNYVLDMVNGELSVGHSFVGGGDIPKIESAASGLLGADLFAENNYWKIERIYTTESWNPGLSSPLDRPGIKVDEGNYLVGINGEELTAADNLYKALDGTSNKQTIIHINSEPEFEGSWKETIKPIRSENALRTRAWVEDNRRLVDKLSGGKLAYIWVPNTSGPGFVSFNRYYFAQQDKEGAVIDERFNGGGLLDDYMVDLMTRKLRAGLTNEVPGGKPFRLPAGILGPKVLLINELAGSGGDFFPWVFRQQNAGPLIGSTTWGGLVKSSVHYALIDGGSVTAPDNAVYDPINNKWVAENEGVPPDIAVRQDALSLSKGIDPQLERAVAEALLLLKKERKIKGTPPPFSKPAKKK